MNKYKEAYDFILTATNGGEGMVKEMNIIRELVEKHDQLENAFNVACKLIFKSTGACPLLAKEFYFPHCEKCRNTGADCWEKYCLKIVKNNKLTKK